MVDSKSSKKTHSNEIAVVGMSVWYPGAVSLTEFWENILAKRQQFRQMPDCRLPQAEYYHPDRTTPDKTYGKEGAFIDGFDYDWQARRVPKKTFESTDIVHWLALEVALKAVDDSRLDIKRLQEIQTGVILGNTLTGEWTRTSSMRLRWPFVAKVIRETALQRGLSHETVEDLVKNAEYSFKSVFPSINEDTLAGALSNTIAGRICNFLDLHGGGYTVDGACSSSLVAVETAANHLVSGSLDVALAGGIDISLDTFELIGFAKTGALTPDEMRVYDKRANGFIPGEGCGFVVLKRLADAERDGDQIYAVIKGWGLSSDGKGGLTAPSIQGQAQAIRKAYDMAGYNVRDLHFVEGHGTGTTLGDKVEISALHTALDGEKPERKIALTSLKSIIGHTKAAAGIGALIKAIIGVNQRIIPPIAGVEEPNDLFESVAMDFYPEINGKILPETTIVRAGVSAMGFGGINTHVTLESYNAPAEHLRSQVPEQLLLASNDRSEAVIFTAPTQSALAKAVAQGLIDARGISRSELADYAFEKSRMIRQDDKFRAVTVVKTPTGLIESLTKVQEYLQAPLQPGELREHQNPHCYGAVAYRKDTPKIGFMFPGQGSQRKGMGLELVHRHGWAGERFATAQENLKNLFDLREMIETGRSGKKVLKDTEAAQPSLSVVSALAHDYLVKAGVRPHAVAGHSLGELSALYAAQAINYKQLIELSQFRGNVMAAPQAEAGSMAYVSSSKSTVEGLIRDLTASHPQGYLTLANYNAPDQVVVSGDAAMIDRLIELTKSKGLQAGRLSVSNAFHSRFMENGAQQMAEHLGSMVFSEPKIPFVTGSTGAWLEKDTNLRAYLTRQITDSVDFVSSFSTLASKCDIIIEVGCGTVLTQLGKKMLPTEKKIKLLSTLASPGNDYDVKHALAVCFALGVNVRWNELFAARFFRPFIPVRERSFIVSPTERPLSFLNSNAPNFTSSQPSLAAAWAERNIPSPDTLGSLSALGQQLRENSIHQLPKTHGDLSAPTAVPSKAQDSSGHILSVPTNSRIPTPNLDSPDHSTKTGRTQAVLDSLYTEISVLTGFDRSTLHPEMKLLDDLHLDSIKSTEFIGNISMQYNVAGELAELQLSNVKLSELAALIVQYSSKDQGPTEGFPNERIDVQGSLRAHSPAPHSDSAPMVLPHEAVSQKLAVIPDASGSVSPLETPVPAAAPLVFLPSSPAPSSVSSLTPRRSEHSEGNLTPSGSSGHARPQRAKSREPWTRNFSEVFIPAPLEADAVATPWLKEKILLVAPNAQEAQKVLPQSDLVQAQAQVETLFMDQEHKGVLNLLSYGTVIVIMDEWRDQDAGITGTVRCLNLLSRSKFARNQKVVFIQRDDGQFGQSQSTRISAKAFAQSLAHERPDLTIRTLSFHAELGSNWSPLRAIGQELLLPQKLGVAGYDQAGQRFVPELKLDRPSNYTKRSTTWSQDDVVLVTGGAKGITAECAFHFAQKHRVKVVLLGTSAAPSASENQTSHPVAAVLKRYEEAGLTAHYLTCDITDGKMVTDAIKQIEETVGPLTGIIHGAGINHPKLLQSVEFESAMREVRPKTQGMIHIMNAINPARLKMVIALTSVIGVVGMPGNGWYGFANENLDLLLRRMKGQHPNLWVQSLAYSVWSEIGMGARLGSDKVLESRGISAIPPSEGVSRFLMLAEHEGHDQQTIITSRLGTTKLSA